MPFRTAISGLNAASADLRVIGNNVANAGTTGFKISRAEFADVFPVSKLGTGSSTMGSGVRLSRIAQQFTQGNVSFTNNNLDLAVNGQGFYRLSDSGTIVYSRAGAFGADEDGYIVNGSGLRLTGYTAEDGQISGTLGDLQLSSADFGPNPTTEASIVANLDASEAAKTGADPALAMGLEVFQEDGVTAYVPPRYEPPDPDSYNHATSFSVFDSLGVAHTATMYFRKTAGNAWTTEMSVDNQAFVAPAPGTALAFSNLGALTGPAGPPLGVLTYNPVTVGTGAADLNFTIDFSDTTQFGTAFSVNALTQDGYTTGQLSGIDVDASGVVYARYTNGQAQALGQVVLANFNNPQGLRQLGDTTFAETAESGEALVGAPGTASLGVIQSGALEDSNVDLTEELVKLIVAQRNFQANAQVISTADAVTQSIINLR